MTNGHKTVQVSVFQFQETPTMISRSCAYGNSLTFTSSCKTMHWHTEIAKWFSFWLAKHTTISSSVTFVVSWIY